MRILYVIDSLVAGGAESSLAAVAPHYPRLGLELDVAYLKERPGLHAELRAAGARLHCLGSAGEGRWSWTRAARDVVRKTSPDIIHTSLFNANVAGRLAGALERVPVVCSLVNETYGEPHIHNPHLSPVRVRAAQLVDAATARVVKRFHAVTRSVAELMARRLLIPRARIDVIPRGRDAAILGSRTMERRERARKALGIAAGTPVLLAAGRQEHQKGFDVLLEAFVRVRERFPDIVLMVAGREGAATPVLAAASDASVWFLGHRTDLPDLLAAADVFVLPSRWEGIPGVVLEALALEAPVVASNLPGVREIVGETDIALLTPVGDPAAIASAVVSTLQDPGAASDRARRGRERFLSDFTIDRVAEQMAAFYGRALESS
jgi:glycosyltransferase involved in cell wall biosynthesis